jgi:hypothetical protein
MVPVRRARRAAVQSGSSRAAALAGRPVAGDRVPAPPCRRADAIWVLIIGAGSEASHIREVDSCLTGGPGNPIGGARNMPVHGNPLKGPDVAIRTECHQGSEVAEALRHNEDREDEADEEAG